MGIDMLHTLNLERTYIPALAIAAELQLPVGPVSAPSTTYSVKMLATKSGSFARVHLNVAAGTYSVRVPTTNACDSASADAFGCGGFIPDVPCSVGPVGSDANVGRSLAASACGGGTQVQRAAVSTPRTHGARWLAGLGIDHAFPLASWLLTADFVAERFEGFQAQTDMTIEAGARWQWSPRVVLDAGVGRRFAGATTASTITLGLTFTAIMRPRAVIAAAPGGK